MSKLQIRHLFDGTRLFLDGASEAQNLSREMILPAYKAAISPGPPPRTNPLSSLIYQQFTTLIMQNKPNLLNAQMNVNVFLKKDYEDIPCLRTPRKQTQSNPIKPNFKLFAGDVIRRKLCSVTVYLGNVSL